MADLTVPTAGGRWRDYAHIARARAGQLLARARAWQATARGHKISLAVPGVAAIALISASAGLRFGTWAGLGVAGLFLLRIDARL